MLAVWVASRAPSYLPWPSLGGVPRAAAERRADGTARPVSLQAPVEVRWYLMNGWEDTLRASLGKTVLLTWLKAKINRH